MLCSESAHHIFNVVHSLWSLSHCLSWVIYMTSWTTPVCEKLRRKRYINIVIFSNATEKISRNPKLISNFNTKTGTNLILPLTWHNLSVCSRNLNPCIETRLVVSINNWTAKSYVWTNRAVVRTLRTGIAIVRPTEGLFSKFGIFLN